ncbi:T9SS type A sorting domain-containing protein [Kordia jejudonensis]|uniref:T9SS type A sorting domain-containing protein n=1 Tax=Kordia jejudonensis TaxID=1348245 RepID=UPI000629986F|nr:T9SS type A sorting domain-containing protein [Kordia jejudonensis]
MRLISTITLLFGCIYFTFSQCAIDPFIQQNYEFDAKLMVLKQIRYNTNDADYDNPFLTQSRVDYHLEKLSAMYANPQNSIEIDSLFNEFQFHVNPSDVQYKKMRFRVNTSVSWVQTLKDTGTSGITDLDNFLSQYQFSVSNFNDSSSTGKTFFELTTAYDFLNMYALLDDLQNASAAIEIINGNGYYDDNVCNYTGVDYSIPDGSLIPSFYSVSMCNIGENTNNNYWFFSFLAPCVTVAVTEYRYVTVSNDCSTVNFSRTLSTEDTELTTVAIYPNPTTDFVQVQGITTIKNVEAYTIQGKKVQIYVDNTSRINVSSLQSGIYFLKIMDAQNRVAIRKFIKK